MTVYELIKSTLRLLRVAASGSEPQAADVEDAFDVLNLMVDSFNAEGLMMFDRNTQSFNLVPGQLSYNIGPSAEWNTVRPIKIIESTIRFAASSPGTPVDYPMGIISSFDYNNIATKYTQSTLPRYIYYEPSYPIGKIYVWPVPSQATPIQLVMYVPLLALSSLSSTVALPPAYADMLRYQLAIKLAPEYRIDLNPMVISEAARLKGLVKSVNNQQLEQPVPLDPALCKQGVRSTWNIYRGDFP
jgi:hypothetical protein